MLVRPVGGLFLKSPETSNPLRVGILSAFLNKSWTPLFLVEPCQPWGEGGKSVQLNMG